MKKISAEIVADSVNEHGNRITTMLLTYPRFIHGELLTHRMFSRNSASSRAIPFEKMVKMVQEDPFTPIAWQKNHKGMQGNEYFESESDIKACTKQWLDARDSAVLHADFMHQDRTTKQLCNRLLEPFMWHTVLVTSGKEGLDNFFELRCPQYGGNHPRLEEKYFRSKIDTIKALEKVGVDTSNLRLDDTLGWLAINKGQAEIHIQALAESMWDAMNESIPKKLQAGEWHIPFGDKIDLFKLAKSSDVPQDFYKSECEYDEDSDSFYQSYLVPQMIKIATARCARLSYMTFDGEIDYGKDIQLHDKLLADGHMSPFEHCARAMNEEEYFCHHKGVVEGEFDYHSEIGSFFRILEEPKFMNDKRNGWCNNFRGFTQYRYIIENNIPL